MRCGEIMKRELEWVLEEDTVEEAARTMRNANVGFLPVCDPEKRVIGTLTDRDIAIRAAAENLVPADTRVGMVMSRDLVCAYPATDLREAEVLMAREHKSRIVIVDERGGLCGVISLSDIIAHESPRRARATMREVVSRELRL